MIAPSRERARSPIGTAPPSARFKRSRSRSREEENEQPSHTPTGWLSRSGSSFGAPQYMPLSTREDAEIRAMEIESKNLSFDGSKHALRAAASKKTSRLPSSINESTDKIGLSGVLIKFWFVSWMFLFVPLGFVAYHLHMG